jgi:hypothetical protein
VSIDAIADAAAGPFAVACALLVFSGASKLRRPVGTQPAAAALGLPASTSAVRTLGLVEISVAVAGLAIGGPAAAGVAVVFGALALVAWRLLARAPGTACGCLGASNAPVTGAHVVINVAAVAAAVLATAAGSPLGAAGDGIWARVAFVLFVGCGAWLGALLLDAVPTLSAATREGTSR